VKLYLVAGEHSGDARGAELMRSLQARSAAPLEFHGIGGPEMQAIAGPHLLDWTAEAVVGLWDVLKKYGYFRAQFARILAEIGKVQPQALILIDYPGFNLRLARAVRQQHPGIRIIYYISPQVWIFPVMLEAAKLLRVSQPSLRFAATAASTEMQTLMLELRAAAGLHESACPITLRNSHELMQRATVGMVASGTATLESAFFGMPTVILYRIAWLTWVIGKRLVRVPFLGMPNILAGREIAREFLQEAAQPEAIAAEVTRIAQSEAVQRTIQADLAEVIAKLGDPGAGDRAAAAVAQELDFA
jgi:lipid A disaccharide synthetase